MADIESARELAKSLVAVANGAGLKTSALLTDMNEPLASAAGNAVEVLNAVAYLVGARREPRLDAVVIALAAEMLVLGGLADGTAEGDAMAREALKSGRAAERFQKMVTALGGPADFVAGSDAASSAGEGGRAGARRRGGHRRRDRYARARPRRRRARRRAHARRGSRSTIRSG